MPDLVELVRRSRDPDTRAEFERRVREQAAYLRGEIESGRLDNEGFALGLEVEVYATDGEGRLARLPDEVFEVCGKELGMHNAELNTDPSRFTPDGLAGQAAALEERADAAGEAATAAGRHLALDAMWTVPPAEGSVPYLSAVEDHDGVAVAENVRPHPRYVALDNEAVERAGGTIQFDVPGASHGFPTILFESLATSIQPHVQVPSTAAFPEYYNAAIRTLGPVLALATNSPLLPGDMYDVDDPRGLLDRTHHELRIAAFEQSMNDPDSRKVRVPADIAAATDVVDRVVADDTFAPFLSEWTDEDEEDDAAGVDPAAFADGFPEFDYKRGTYWRWLRCVIGGDPVAGAGDERSLRIEYRPLPTQPTVADTAGLLALTAGLLRGIVATDHPLVDLPWADAEACFYDVVAEGLDAELAWVTADGTRTSDPEAVFEEVFELARRGLAEQGFDPAETDEWLAPVRARWEARTAPSDWKLDRVREGLDRGLTLAEAIAGMQREYHRLSRERESFADWL